VTHACGTTRPISVKIADLGFASGYTSTTSYGITTTPYMAGAVVRRVLAFQQLESECETVEGAVDTGVQGSGEDDGGEEARCLLPRISSA
jgi:hypothetical protein